MDEPLEGAALHAQKKESFWTSKQPLHVRILIVLVVPAVILSVFYGATPNIFSRNAAANGLVKANLGDFSVGRSGENATVMLTTTEPEMDGSILCEGSVQVGGILPGAGGMYQPCRAVIKWEGFPSRYKLIGISLPAGSDMRYYVEEEEIPSVLRRLRF